MVQSRHGALLCRRQRHHPSTARPRLRRLPRPQAPRHPQHRRRCRPIRYPNRSRAPDDPRQRRCRHDGRRRRSRQGPRLPPPPRRHRPHQHGRHELTGIGITASPADQVLRLAKLAQTIRHRRHRLLRRRGRLRSAPPPVPKPSWSSPESDLQAAP